MKAKLIKKKEGWYNLYQDSIGIASTHEELQGYKLSLKNCQAIERGYDLDELATKFTKDESYGELNGDLFKGYIFGFQKALSILGDKKFSEGQMKSLFAKTLESSPSTESHTRMISDIEYRHFVMDEMYNRIIKSLQQTEWDVEIEMDILNEYDRPKLDADGCLILKRV